MFVGKLNVIWLVFRNSIRKPAITKAAMMGGTTNRATRTNPGRDVSSANCRSLSRSMRVVTRPVIEPSEVVSAVTGSAILPHSREEIVDEHTEQRCPVAGL